MFLSCAERSEVGMNVDTDWFRLSIVWDDGAIDILMYADDPDDSRGK